MKLLFILTGLLISYSLNAQEINISEWQGDHPDVLFIEQDVYDAFGEKQLDKLTDNLIVYNTSIQIEDIEYYVARKSLNPPPNLLFDYSDPDAEFIKHWLGEHKQIAIVRYQKFSALSPNKQSDILHSGALILTAEYLTLEKIVEYEANH